jgi:hypothetical protein
VERQSDAFRVGDGDSTTCRIVAQFTVRRVIATNVTIEMVPAVVGFGWNAVLEVDVVG